MVPHTRNVPVSIFPDVWHHWQRAGDGRDLCAVHQTAGIARSVWGEDQHSTKRKGLMRAVRGRWRVFRHWMGFDGRLSRSVVCAGWERCFCNDCCDSKRIGGNVGLRLTSAAIAALEGNALMRAFAAYVSAQTISKQSYAGVKCAPVRRALVSWRLIRTVKSAF